MIDEPVVHGIEWTIKELFVYPNEFIYWSIQIVMYPYMTGLRTLSSLHRRPSPKVVPIPDPPLRLASKANRPE